MNSVGFGVRLPVAGPLSSPAAIVKAAQAAEGLGFDIVWVYDHIAWSRKQDRTHISVGSVEAVEEALAKGDYAPDFYESITTMAYLAGQTKSVKIGVAVLCLPYRHPVTVAKQLATLDVLSGGRLVLGMGSGALKTTGSMDFEAVGVPRTEKYERAYEYTDVVRKVWTEDQPSYEGRFVSFPPIEVYPKPLQKPYPPLWIAAKWERPDKSDGSGVSRGMEIVAEFGDGWFIGGRNAGAYPEALDDMKELARTKGRGDVDFALVKEVSACIGRTSEDAQNASRRTLEASVGHFSARKTLQDAISGTFVGSPEELRDRVGHFVKGGVNHFELKFMYQSVDHLIDQMSLWSEEIAPAFQGRGRIADPGMAAAAT
jgi:probable F420-dependent oxidoreductase